MPHWQRANFDLFGWLSDRDLNKAGRLIRRDYVLAKLRLAARPNIISLIRTPRRLFGFSDCHGPAVTSSSHHAYSFHSPLARVWWLPTMLVIRHGVSGDAQSNLSSGAGGSV